MRRHPRRIMVGFDFSPLSEQALAEALQLAGETDHAEVHVVYVFDDVANVDAAHLQLKTELQRLFERWSQIHKGATLPRTYAHVRVGAPAAELVRLAGEVGSDLLIVGTHGRRWLARAIMGSVAEHVVQRAPCRVLVVRPRSWVHRCAECVIARQRSEGKHWFCDEHERDAVALRGRTTMLIAAPVRATASTSPEAIELLLEGSL